MGGRCILNLVRLHGEDTKEDTKGVRNEWHFPVFRAVLCANRQRSAVVPSDFRRGIVAEEDQLDFATVRFWSKILSAAVFLGGSFHFDQGRPPCQFISLPLCHEINSA
jgi:hypothetical protein